jgi:hypothetical protein
MSSNITLYRLYCNTEGTFGHVWGHSPPTKCPYDSGHEINPKSQVPIMYKTIKAISADDSPYYICKEFLHCDTTGGQIEIYLANCSVLNTPSVYVTKTNGDNDILVYDNNKDLIQTITDSDKIYKFINDTNNWYARLLDDTPEDGYGLNLNETTSIIHNKGDLMTNDTILPIGNDGDYLSADSSVSRGMKWKLLPTSVSSGRNWSINRETNIKANNSGTVLKFLADKDVDNDLVSQVVALLDIGNSGEDSKNTTLSVSIVNSQYDSSGNLNVTNLGTSDSHIIVAGNVYPTQNDHNYAVNECPATVIFTFDPPINITNFNSAEISYNSSENITVNTWNLAVK